MRPLNLEIIEGGRYNGRDTNFENIHGNKWTIQVGDSAEAWAKSVGKLFAGAPPAEVDTLVLDFSQIRPAGSKLKGYGWACNGFRPILAAYKKIAELRNSRINQLFTELDIIQVVNLLGTVVSCRAAEMALFPATNPRFDEFANYKTGDKIAEHPERAQSNNSLLYWVQPDRGELDFLFQTMVECGGSEPGLYNAATAIQRAPWFSGTNPCGEILLPNQGFCNLCEFSLPRFTDGKELHESLYLLARANYRQTIVDLNDGILSPGWHQTNEALRLCGVGLAGVAEAGIENYNLKKMRQVAREGAFSMANEVGLERPKAVTTMKPGGTVPKLLDTTSGISNPVGRYVFYNVNFSVHSPMCEKLTEAGYHSFTNPYDAESNIFSLPVDHGSNVPDQVLESAVDQLERYKKFMTEWCDHNVSSTIRYDKEEIPQITEWIHNNWDDFVGVAFMLNTDEMFAYHPHELVTKERFDEYTKNLQDIQWASQLDDDLIDTLDCAGGSCPVR